MTDSKQRRQKEIEKKKRFMRTGSIPLKMIHKSRNEERPSWKIRDDSPVHKIMKTVEITMHQIYVTLAGD